MSGFTADWLEVRESADHAARAMQGPLVLAQRFADMARERARGIVRLVDLAGGTGSNIRFLAPLIRGEQHWAVWDNDGSLLARLFDSCRSWARDQGWDTGLRGDTFVATGPDLSLSISGVVRDLRQHLDFNAFDGVSCAALLDLVSDSWCDGFIKALTRAGFPPVLCSLVADGGWSWTPALPDDGAICRLFARDMGTDKGFGPSMGYGAAPAVMDMLRAYGYSVDQVTSPWHIASNAMELQTCLLDFQATAIEGAGGAETERWRYWLTERRNLLGQQKLCVGHREILASR